MMKLYSMRQEQMANFEGCKRGFSGITSHIGTNTPDKLVFTSSVGAAHTDGAVIENLNILFLLRILQKKSKLSLHQVLQIDLLHQM